MSKLRLVLGSLVFLSTTLWAQTSEEETALRTPTKKSTELSVTGEQLQDASGGQIPFQGRLTESGSPVTGTREFTFTIQIDQSTTWTETHPTVQVTNGFYSIVLGSITPLPANLFAGSASRDVAITVDAQALSPVQIYAPFGSVNGEDVTFNGPNDSLNVFLGGTAGGYNGSLELADSLGYSSFFVNAENDGAYMQFSTQDINGNFQNALVAQSFENRSNLSLFGQNFDQTSVQRMINHYVTNTEIGLGGAPYADTYIRSGSDWFDNQGTLLAAIGNARDPNNGDPNGKSGFMSLWGTNTFNVELTGKRWQNDDLPIFQLFGSNDDGAGWWLSNFTAEIDTSAGNESFASLYMNNTASGGTSNETVLISSNLFGSQSGGLVLRDPSGADRIEVNAGSGQIGLREGGAYLTNGPDQEINTWLGFNWLNGGTQINNRGALILFGDTTTRDALGGVDIRRASLTVADDGFGRDVGNLLLHAPVVGDNELVDLGVNTDGTIYKGRLILKGSDGSFFEITSDGLGSAPQTSYTLNEFVGELRADDVGNGLFGQINFSGVFDGTVLNSGGASMGAKGFDALNPNNGYVHVNDTVGTAAKMEAISDDITGENFGIVEVRSTFGASLFADPRGISIADDLGNVKTELNIFQTNNAGSLLLRGNNNNRNIIIGATGTTGGNTGFIGLYDTNDQDKLVLRVDTLTGGGQDYGFIRLNNTDYSREMSLNASESRIQLSSGGFTELMAITDVGIAGGINSFDRGFNLNMDQTGGALLEMFNGGQLNVFLGGDAGEVRGRQLNVDGSSQLTISAFSNIDNGNIHLYGETPTGDNLRTEIEVVPTGTGNSYGRIQIRDTLRGPAVELTAAGQNRIALYNRDEFAFNITGALSNIDNGTSDYGFFEVREESGVSNVNITGQGIIDVNGGSSRISLFDGVAERASLQGNTASMSLADGTNTRVFMVAPTGGAPNIQMNNAAGVSRAWMRVNSNGTEEYGELQLSSDTAVNAFSVQLDGLRGNINIFGSLTQASDERLKENIKTQTNSLEKVKSLRGVEFAWKNKNKSQKNIGFIAQEMEEVYPELVKTTESGYKTVDYASLVSALVEAIKELDQKVSDLESENKELKAELAKSSSKEIEELRAEIESIKAIISSSQNVGK